MKQRQLFDKNRHLFITKIVTCGDLCVPVMPQSSTEKIPETDHQNLYDLMKPLILFGRVITVIPRGKLDTTTYNGLKYSKISAIPSVLMMVWSMFKIVLYIRLILSSEKEGTGFMGYIIDSRNLVNTLFQFFIYSYFLLKSDKFYKILDEWSSLSKAGVVAKDPFLRNLAYILFIGIILPLASQIWGIAQAINRMTILDPKGRAAPLSALEAFFAVFMKPFHVLQPYSPCFAVVNIILYLWGHLPSMITPLIIIYFARALSFQFKDLVVSSCNSTADEVHNVDMKQKGKEFWRNLVYKYRKLLNILKTMNNFLSPVVFWWTVLSIYNISLELFRSLSRGTALHVPTSFFATMFALEVSGFVITMISAAMVNKNAVRMLILLRNCPEEDFYDTEVCRLEHQIATGQNLGFSGLGCFVITKPFLLKVFNAIFTMEIVMLQSEPMDTNVK